MKCYHCNEEIIWGNDFDIEEELEATQNGGLINMDQPSPQPEA